MKNITPKFLELSESVILDSISEVQVTTEGNQKLRAHVPIRRARWFETEAITLKKVLRNGYTLRIISRYLPNRSDGAIIKKAQRLGYRRHTNSDGVIEFKYGIKSRNRGTNEELFEAGQLSEVAEEVFGESSTAIIPTTSADDKLELARSYISEALVLINEVSEPGSDSQL